MYFATFPLHKQVTLEAYDQQCDEAARIFAEYHKRLQFYVNQARDAQRSGLDYLGDLTSKLSTDIEREAVYSSVRGSKSADDVILETTRERSVRKACESLASRMVDRICNSFPAYEGSGIHSHPELETAKLSFEYDGEISDEMRAVLLNCLSSPPLLLQAIAAHTLRLKTLITKEVERVDVRADAETLRYKYENNRIMFKKDIVSGFLLSNGLACAYGLFLGQLLHVNLLHDNDHTFRIHLSYLVRMPGTCTLISEIQRLNKLCAERKEAEHSLKQKWKKIEEFDARRSELETIYTTLLKANMDAAEFWKQQPLAAGEYAMATIIPACEVVADISKNSKDFIEKEVSAFFQSPDNTLYMLQDLVESGRSLLSHAYHSQQEYERTTKHCLDLATEQDNGITEKWLPELKTAVLNAQTSLEHCKYVWGLLDEWYEQPAATVVDWVTVDGQNVAAWHNHVKSSYCLLR
ncbi:unnamed protein product [Eruca vesicaria subsp. sativa]|uniref:AUGMIN subunit 5 n=1 Tax=Eruca vesicaria subsp. sativa TaxID=29727 RepID=A0ABC8LMT6_ERUVS|nr:unnamed protein product [Eruca vesicaria subsp. sativa]